MTRREFFWSALTLGTASLLPRGLVAAEPPAFDERLSIFLSDIHVNGLDTYPGGKGKGKPIKGVMRKCLKQSVDEILSMNPRPRYVFVFGDIAYLNGRASDYARSKPEFQRLVDAGIKLTLGMGNHDHRAAFLEAWPEYRERTVVQGLVVTVTEMPDVDFIMLDSLDDNGKPESRNPSKGTFTSEQQAWIKAELPKRKRPFLLGAHHSPWGLAVPAKKGTVPLVDFLRTSCPKFRGYVHGHDHIWKRNFTVWTDRAARPLLTLPSNGCWGDIGYVTFRTGPKKAVATLVQKDFFLHDPLPPGQSRAAWANRIEDNKGEHCTFAL